MRAPQTKYEKEVLSFLEQTAHDYFDGDIEAAAGNILDVDNIVQAEGGGAPWEAMKEAIILLTAPGYMPAVQHSGDGGLTRSDWYPVGSEEFATPEGAEAWAKENIVPASDGRNMFCSVITWDYDRPKDDCMIIVQGIW